VRRLTTVLTACAVTAFSSGCLTTKPGTYISNLNLDSTPTVEDFEVCSSSGCRNTTRLSYSPEEWQRIAQIFEPAPTNATEERERINIAIGVIETIIGSKNGTSGDAPKNKRHLGTGNQLDCIAEAANTTVALLLLDQKKLLRFHEVGRPQHRGFTRLLYPHNAASVIEKSTGEKYIIDSWFFAGGKPSISLPVDEWKSGYDPHEDPDFPLDQSTR